MLIPELSKSLQVLTLDLMSAFGLRYLNQFLVLKLITDAVTINHPDMVDNILPSCARLICSPILAIVKDVISQGTTQPLVLIIHIIYVTGVAVSSNTTSSDTHSAAS